MDPEKIFDGISKEIFAVLKAMEKAKTPEEKRIYSETVKNLCDSIEVFLNFAGDIAPYDNDNDDEPIPF